MPVLNLAYVPSGNYVQDFNTSTMVVGVRHSLLVPSPLIRRKLWFGSFQTGGAAPYVKAFINLYQNGSLITQIPMQKAPAGEFTYGFNAQSASTSARELFVFFDSIADGFQANPYELTAQIDQVDFEVVETRAGTLKNYTAIAIWSENLTPPI